ncbi:hypothetical protein A2363_05285 [Candidatus Gottesmanbacteria bacterium RIFOXYB1_FULL_47_11]|uniref:Uncharacterized protein n=1 Tax=Candidatus Gottesmanbacteria bacterium RIFOXYB1_FULL_47_11 TaxID=1798401 RepID=A0A1F6BF50_9BACT|nr:MAG: hypothetical protein A2363_05285 [Candidatus Gottesmanbacteria bacterium RIFOXYB1_FULL_47_11]
MTVEREYFSNEFVSVQKEADVRLPKELRDIVSACRSWWLDYGVNPFHGFPVNLGYAVGGILFHTGYRIDDACDRPSMMNRVSPEDVITRIDRLSVYNDRVHRSFRVSDILTLVHEYIESEPGRNRRTRLGQAFDEIAGAVRAVARQYTIRNTAYTQEDAFTSKEQAIWPIYKLTFLLSESPGHYPMMQKMARLRNAQLMYKDDLADLKEDMETGRINTVIGAWHDLERSNDKDASLYEAATVIRGTLQRITSRLKLVEAPMAALLSVGSPFWMEDFHIEDIQ